MQFAIISENILFIVEDLNKHQLILLTLLVSFVTSIATGIITFTLLQEAPVEVTNTINRVVERTIEQVTPANGGQTTVKEVQVVNEEDLVLSSIDKNTKSIVRIKTKNADGTDTISGLGLVLSKDGVIMMDARSYNPNFPVYATFLDGRSYSADKVFTDTANGLVFMRLSMTGHDVNQEPAFVPAAFGDSSILKLGQSIINISGKDSNAVNIGRVSQIVLNTDKTPKLLISDMKISNSVILPGSPIFNLAGEIDGFEYPPADGDATYSFEPINSLKTAINNGLTQVSK